jgi:hypothetical protein
LSFIRRGTRPCPSFNDALKSARFADVVLRFSTRSYTFFFPSGSLSSAGIMPLPLFELVLHAAGDRCSDVALDESEPVSCSANLSSYTSLPTTPLPLSTCARMALVLLSVVSTCR